VAGVAHFSLALRQLVAAKRIVERFSLARAARRILAAGRPPSRRRDRKFQVIIIGNYKQVLVRRAHVARGQPLRCAAVGSGSSLATSFAAASFAAAPLTASLAARSIVAAPLAAAATSPPSSPTAACAAILAALTLRFALRRLTGRMRRQIVAEVVQITKHIVQFGRRRQELVFVVLKRSAGGR
jgi:hypothetical protein